MGSRSLVRVLGVPEANVATISFFLNLPWEMWQIPFFEGMSALPHGEGVKFCTQAAAGDALISVTAFWAVAMAVRSRRWVLHPTWGQVGGFVSVGLAVTIAFELLATEFLERWRYAEAMPTLPGLGTGLLPVLQWVLIPPLVLWVVRRQIR